MFHINYCKAFRFWAVCLLFSAALVFVYISFYFKVAVLPSVESIYAIT